MIEIKHRITGEVLATGETIREAAESARNLRDADLSGANLYRVYLHDKDLSGADLTEADLTEADLREVALRAADLNGANLRLADLRLADLRETRLLGASLSEANLQGAKGILHPPVNDPRGYRCVAVWRGGCWMIAAGCRWFTVGWARRHWGPDYEGDRAIADGYLSALDWLEAQPVEGKS